MARVDDVGYYEALGLKLNATMEEISSAYKKKALRLHPDRNRSDPDATTRFQQLVTAYHVLRNQKSKVGYDRIFELRTYMYQQADPSGTVDPYLIFPLRKINKNSKKQDRTIQLNFVTRVLNNFEKDKLKKSFSFDEFLSIETSQNPLDFIINFKKSDKNQRPYHYRAFCVEDKEKLVGLLTGTLGKSLQIKMSDFPMPPLSLHKGEVDKKRRMGGWARRNIMLGTSALLIFRDSAYSMFVNVLLLGDNINLSSSSDNQFSLVNEDRTQSFTFRCDTKEEAFKWRQMIRKILRGQALQFDRRPTRLSESHIGAQRRKSAALSVTTDSRRTTKHRRAVTRINLGSSKSRLAIDYKKPDATASDDISIVRNPLFGSVQEHPLAHFQEEDGKFTDSEDEEEDDAKGTTTATKPPLSRAKSETVEFNKRGHVSTSSTSSLGVDKDDTRNKLFADTSTRIVRLSIHETDDMLLQSRSRAGQSIIPLAPDDDLPDVPMEPPPPTPPGTTNASSASSSSSSSSSTSASKSKYGPAPKRPAPSRPPVASEQDDAAAADDAPATTAAAAAATTDPSSAPDSKQGAGDSSELEQLRAQVKALEKLNKELETKNSAELKKVQADKEAREKAERDEKRSDLQAELIEIQDMMLQTKEAIAAQKTVLTFLTQKAKEVKYQISQLSANDKKAEEEEYDVLGDVVSGAFVAKIDTAL